MVSLMFSVDLPAVKDVKGPSPSGGRKSLGLSGFQKKNTSGSKDEAYTKTHDANIGGSPSPHGVQYPNCLYKLNMIWGSTILGNLHLCSIPLEIGGPIFREAIWQNEAHNNKFISIQCFNTFQQ